MASKTASTPTPLGGVEAGTVYGHVARQRLPIRLVGGSNNRRLISGPRRRMASVPKAPAIYSHPNPDQCGESGNIPDAGQQSLLLRQPNGGRGSSIRRSRPAARPVRQAERDESDYYWDAISSDTMLERLDYSSIFFRTITGFVASPRVRDYWPVPWAAVLCFGLEAAALQALETLKEMQMADLQFLKGFTAVQQFLTAPLGFLVVFRANQAYNRWREARITVGSVLTTVHEMGQYAAATVPTEEDLRVILTLLSAFTLAFQNAFDPLAGTEQEAQLRTLLGDEMYEVAAPTVVGGQTTGSRETAESLVQMAMQQLICCSTAGPTAGVSAGMSSSILQGLERCIALATTPISRSYTVQLRYLLFIFLLSVPTYLVDNVDNWLVVPDTMVIASAFLGIDLMSTVISNPFGDDTEDLPLEALAEDARNRLDRILTTRQKMEQTGLRQIDDSA